MKDWHSKNQLLRSGVVFNRTQLAAERLGEEPPSYDLVYDVVSHLPTDLLTLAHQGAKAYSTSFELVYRREAGCPNAIWQADHTPLDIELVQSELGPKITAKPWLTVILDDYSRAVALVRIPIYTEHRPCFAAGHLA